jgi:hypothetical protein
MERLVVLLYALPLVLQGVVPVALLASLWFVPVRNRATALLRLSLLTAYLIAIALAGLWLVVPRLLALVYVVVLALGASRVTIRMRAVPWWPSRPHQWRTAAVNATLLLGCLWVVWMAVEARHPPIAPIVDLQFPLRGGRYLVVNGGSRALINAHLQTLDAPRLRRFRGQSYGVDIVAVDALGLRARGVAPRDPRAYVIFGTPVHAPCSGTVLRSRDGLADMPPPTPDRSELPGNFVFIECGDVHVLLGHLQRGTVRVRAGERLAAGHIVGKVGNSGNTNEPHLHVHAQRPANGEAFLSGDPLPIRMNGRFLVRNDRVHVH